MSVNYNADVDSIGGGLGGFGGLGGGNGLLWLALLSQNGGLFGNKALQQDTAAAYQQGEQMSKVDAIINKQGAISEQLNQQSDNARFEGLNGQIVNLTGIQRDSTAFLQNSINALSRENAECCCEIREGLQSVRTDLAMQTRDIDKSICDSTRAILDRMTADKIDEKNDEIARLRQESQTGSIIAGQQNQTSQLLAAIAALGNGGHGGGNPHDIMALVKAIKGS